MTVRKPIDKKTIKDYLKKLRPLRQGFDLISSPVIVTDPHGNILYANQAVEKNTGFTRNEILTKNPGDLWGGNMDESFYAKMWDTIKTKKKPFVGEVRNVNKKGEEYWQEIRVTPILDENGEIEFFMGIQPDITNRKKQEIFRQEFISIVGHQIKNPVAATDWALEFLTKEKTLSREQKSILSDLYSNNKGLKKLVNDLLLLSRAQDFKGALKNEKVNLQNTIQEAIKLVRPIFKKVKFEVSAPTKKVEVKGNKALVSQIFVNLLDNAARYSDKTPAKVRVDLKKVKNYWILAIKDNGIGIPKSEQKYIFEKFYRGTKAKKMRSFGSGLGLYIIKLISETLDWQINFTSKPHKGTTFYIKIPK